MYFYEVNKYVFDEIMQEVTETTITLMINVY